ncbi:MAG: anti-sigma factor antagonist [Planctomycetia bacterium]|nr:anti-sigma factor antagonist [Planctomycetia bacterium]
MVAGVGTVRYVRAGQAIAFHVAGRGVMQHGLPLRRAAENLLESGVRQVSVHLRECAYMDSTFLGTLLKIGKKLEEKGGSPIALVDPSPACAKIIREMGLGEFIVPADKVPEVVGPWVALTIDNSDTNSFRRNITEAHDELATLPGQAGEQFRGVMRCLRPGEKKPTDQ